MLLLALGATLVGFALLVIALFTGTLWLAIACIVICVVGIGFLVADMLGIGHAHPSGGDGDGGEVNGRSATASANVDSQAGDEAAEAEDEGRSSRTRTERFDDDNPFAGEIDPFEDTDRFAAITDAEENRDTDAEEIRDAGSRSEPRPDPGPPDQQMPGDEAADHTASEGNPSSPGADDAASAHRFGRHRHTRDDD